MGCDFTIHVGKVPIVRHVYELPLLLLGKNVEVDLEKAAKQPHIVVAECSFLKAALYEDEETFIPYIVSRLSDLIPCGNTGRTRKIDDKLIIEVENAWEMHKKLNKSNYKVYTTKKELLEFFKKYKGKECYYLCW